MGTSRVFARSIGGMFLVMAFRATPLLAQAQAPAGHEQHQPQPAAKQEDHAEQVAPGMAQFSAREGSGTSWLPDSSPMYGIHRRARSWELMAHGNAFVQFLHESGDRGNDQGGSINWIMGMARRSLAGGRFGARTMLSLEPWTIPGCGYPDLLATGEVCNGETIHDRQHPHDLFMELAAEYDRPIKGSLRWQLYGGLAGEPALGPVAYPHRLSALPNPLAPIAHHWLDATHITFGVVTAGVSGGRWKVEASTFNGREPDENRGDLDLDALDSLSARLWFLPTSSVALQVSAGHLNEAEASHDGGSRIDVDRLTASATYHRTLGANSLWATTLAWGRNEEEGDSTNALLVETNVTLHDRDTWFGRFEVAGKPAEDLDVAEGEDPLTVTKFQAGYTRYLDVWRGWKPGLGGEISLGIVPDGLRSTYGSRVNLGFGLFITLRPAVMDMAALSHTMHQPAAPASVPADHSTHTKPAAPQAGAGKREPAPERKAEDPKLPVIEPERIVDPACAARIDLRTAPRATYQGRLYYFCSTADRDEFLNDPAAYLKKRAK